MILFVICFWKKFVRALVVFLFFFLSLSLPFLSEIFRPAKRKNLAKSILEVDFLVPLQEANTCDAYDDRSIIHYTEVKREKEILGARESGKILKDPLHIIAV